MTRARGFTLIETVVVVAVIGIVAAIVVASSRAAARNGNLASAGQELRTRLGGLRATAMAEGSEHALVVVDAPGSDASGCGFWDTASCARYFVLRDLSPGWSLDDFDPAAPGGSGTSTASVLAIELLPRGVHLDAAAVPPARPAPFTGIAVHDPELMGKCGDRACVAVRFTARGRVEAAPVVPTPGAKLGVAFVLGTDLTAETTGAVRQELLVTFPAGIVKSLTF